MNSIEFSENKKTLTLEVFNKDKIPIKIVNLKIGNNLYTPSNKNYLFKEDDFLRAKIKKIKFLSNEDPKKNININKEKDIKNNLYSIKLNYKIAGIESLKSISTNVFIKSKSASIIDPLITRKPTHNLFPSLLKDEAKKIIKISDDLIIEKHLIIPLDYKLIISPGTKIKIKKGGSILVQGPLIINGEELEKVNIVGFAGGGGLTVLNSSETSVIKHTIFEGLSSNITPSTNVTGGVSFYNSSINIFNSKFIDSFSEDSLNLVRSPFL